MTVQQLINALQVASDKDGEVRIIFTDTSVVAFAVRFVQESPAGVCLGTGEVSVVSRDPKYNKGDQ